MLPAMSLLRMAGSPLLYMFAYLNLPQQYECRDPLEGTWSTCDIDTVICPALESGSPIEYRVDESYYYYVDNWLELLGLQCTPISVINLPYMFYFIFFGVGGLLTAPVIDKIGRKKSHWIFSTGSILAQAIATFVPNHLAHIFGYSLMGFLSAKNALTCAWTFEFVLNKHKGCTSTCIILLDLAVTIVGGVFFLFISRDWKLLMYSFFGAGALGFTAVSLLLPESPKWLLLQGRKAEAIEALNYIATINRSENRISQDVNFIEDAIAENLENN